LDTGYQGYPCIDTKGDVVGIVTHSDVRSALSKGLVDAKVSDIETRQGLEVVYPDNTLEEAMELIASTGFGHLPVVDRQNQRRLVGFLTRDDILKVYKDKKKERKRTWL
jgi:CIC family chloride channel protein